MARSLDRQYPAIDDLARAAERRIPRFAWEYLVGGVGREAALHRNRAALDSVLFDARYHPPQAPGPVDLRTRIFGRDYTMPFGVAPVGLSGLIWPQAAETLARAAAAAGIPVGLSHHATTGMRKFHSIADGQGWFQLYPVCDPALRAEMIREIAEAGFGTLVVTADIPVAARRARELRVGLSVPPRFSFRTVLDIAARPAWALATLRAGIPRFENLLDHVPPGLSRAEEAQYLIDFMEVHVTPAVLEGIRAAWPGTLIVKGIMTGEDARVAHDCGADGIWVSNHGARQLDAAPPVTAVLPGIRASLGPDIPVLADSGVRSGLDIARMLALGADMVFLGRAFLFAAAALGQRGPAHAVHILREELRSTLAQIGCARPRELSRFFRPAGSGQAGGPVPE